MESKKDNRFGGMGVYLFVIIVIALIWFAVYLIGNQSADYTYSDFKKDIKNENKLRMASLPQGASGICHPFRSASMR